MLRPVAWSAPRAYKRTRCSCLPTTFKQTTTHTFSKRHNAKRREPKYESRSLVCLFDTDASKPWCAQLPFFITFIYLFDFLARGTRRAEYLAFASLHESRVPLTADPRERRTVEHRKIWVPGAQSTPQTTRPGAHHRATMDVDESAGTGDSHQSPLHEQDLSINRSVEPPNDLYLSSGQEKSLSLQPHRNAKATLPDKPLPSTRSSSLVMRIEKWRHEVARSHSLMSIPPIYASSTPNSTGVIRVKVPKSNVTRQCTTRHHEHQVDLKDGTSYVGSEQKSPTCHTWTNNVTSPPSSFTSIGCGTNAPLMNDRSTVNENDPSEY